MHPAAPLVTALRQIGEDVAQTQQALDTLLRETGQQIAVLMGRMAHDLQTADALIRRLEAL